jgi:hypothetical protein
MKKIDARNIINKYLNSWLKKDMALFSSVIHEKVIVKECYGPIYKWKSANLSWFRRWNEGNNKVTRWKIKSFSFDTDHASCAFEWDFSCTYAGQKHSFSGCSYAILKEGKILRLNEYKMKKE